MTRADRINHLARLCKAKRYLEIGVCHGETFFLVNVPHKVAVDPLFRFDVDQQMDKNSIFHQIGSDEFFANYNGPPFDLIYLDGLHTFDQTSRDFFSSFRHSHQKTVWILDDTVPSDVFSAESDMERCYKLRQTVGDNDWSWMGDVYKTIFMIERMLPFFHFRTFGGHGQTVIWREAQARPVGSKTLGLERVGSMTYVDMVSHLDTMRIESDDDIFQAVEQAMKTR